jgi:hypothetical protein
MGKSAHQNQADYYRSQAHTALEQAGDAQLDNVRDRCLRSAEAWTHMAERAERHEASRQKSEALKAAAAAELPAWPVGQS